MKKDFIFFFSFFLFFFFFSCPCSIWELLGQGPNSRGSCSNTRSLTHCMGFETVPPQRQAGSLTHCATVETPIFRTLFFLFLYIEFSISRIQTCMPTSTEKKKRYNLKVAYHVLFGNFTADYNPAHSLSDSSEELFQKG